MEHYIDLATEFIAGIGYEAFRDDTRTVCCRKAGVGHGATWLCPH
jgi:hypothetical protein